MDVPVTYPADAVKIYFGEEAGLFHMNTWNNENHLQCIDKWTKQSSMLHAIQKTLGAIGYEEAIRRIGSPANPAAITWQTEKEKSGEFPLFNQQIFFKKPVAVPRVQMMAASKRPLPRPAIRR